CTDGELHPSGTKGRPLILVLPEEPVRRLLQMEKVVEGGLDPMLKDANSGL
ncbi:MAG: hypothetical protein ISS60_07605, partial [Desulfobacteraceae bacterium]|nr:hypothetical protein [Desulfobacteraceae bacterium]